MPSTHGVQGSFRRYVVTGVVASIILAVIVNCALVSSIDPEGSQYYTSAFEYVLPLLWEFLMGIPLIFVAGIYGALQGALGHLGARLLAGRSESPWRAGIGAAIAATPLPVLVNAVVWNLWHGIHLSLFDPWGIAVLQISGVLSVIGALIMTVSIEMHARESAAGGRAESAGIAALVSRSDS